jgi:hypothetical protein
MVANIVVSRTTVATRLRESLFGEDKGDIAAAEKREWRKETIGRLRRATHDIVEDVTL